MGEIWFIRHGQASYGSANYDKLSPLGHQQSDWLGHHLAGQEQRFDRIVSGTLRRHRETAGNVLKHFGNPEVIEDERLNEMAYFALERAYCQQTGDELPADETELPLHFARVMQAWEADEISDPPETFATFQSRVLGAVRDAVTKDQTSLIVSSGGPKGVLLRDVLGLNSAAMIDVILGTFNSSYSRFRLVDDRLRLSLFNGLTHLDTPERLFARTYI